MEDDFKSALIGKFTWSYSFHQKNFHTFKELNAVGLVRQKVILIFES